MCTPSEPLRLYSNLSTRVRPVNHCGYIRATAPQEVADVTEQAHLQTMYGTSMRHLMQPVHHRLGEH